MHVGDIIIFIFFLHTQNLSNYNNSLRLFRGNNNSLLKPSISVMSLITAQNAIRTHGPSA